MANRPFRPIPAAMVESKSPRFQLVLGDSRSMDRVADESVELVVTSPPYWQLKDYGSSGQLGFHQTYEEYRAALGDVWAECARVIAPGCRVVVNVGDQFARAEVYGRYRVIPIHAAVIDAFDTLDLDFMGSIIWQKVTTCNSSGGGAVMGSFPFPRNGIVKLDYEHILIFKKPGTGPRPDPASKEASRLTTEEWNQYFYGHWTFPGAKQRDHIAVFPDELPRRLIRMFTFPGETVLDPFLGSGTTLRVARELDRSAIGYEVNCDFESLIRERTGFGRERDILLTTGELEVIREPSAVSPPSDSLADESAGRRSKPGGYGSVVKRGDSRYRETYRRVSRIVDPCRVEFEDGTTVSLVGLDPREGFEPKAVEFLESLVNGQRVFTKPDPGVEEPDRVYLFLKNRTCVNSRLVREGLADLRVGEEFRQRKRYERYVAEREDFGRDGSERDRAGRDHRGRDDALTGGPNGDGST